MAARARASNDESAAAEADLYKLGSRSISERKEDSTAPNSARARCVSACCPEAASPSSWASCLMRSKQCVRAASSSLSSKSSSPASSIAAWWVPAESLGL
eukprot:scaffold2226_cov28-Tisochrysis_lutea.AAC.4